MHVCVSLPLGMCLPGPQRLGSEVVFLGDRV